MEQYKDKVTFIYAKKMFYLGGFYKPPTTDFNKCVVNLSSKSFSPWEKFLLSLGLDHAFCPKFNILQWQVSFENYANIMSNRPIMKNQPFKDYCEDLKQVYNNVLDLNKKK